MFLLTPIVPMNYFVVLMVVIAIYQPTFGPLWAMPLLLWVGPGGHERQTVADVGGSGNRHGHDRRRDTLGAP